jgi:methyltransferase (TIGR00027 family)
MARRIESMASMTADIVCGCRAISYLETNEMFKSDDWVAPKLLPKKLQILIKIPVARYFLKNLLGKRGIYEWVIARTKYIDNVFKQINEERFSQVLIFGAGFDSRGVRFQDYLKNVKIFELDVPSTQNMKRDQFKKRGIQIPSNLVLVPINFEKELIADRLKESGFTEGKKTLVVLEGVLQYLAPKAAYATFDTIKSIIGPESWIIFDYAHASVLNEHSKKDEKAMLNELNKFGESWQFALNESEVEPLLNKYGFDLIDKKGPMDLENDYFKKPNGKIDAKINGTQSIIRGEKRRFDR